MFFRRRIFAVLVIALLVIGALTLGGYAGWSQGYATGLATGGEASVVVPYAPYGFGFHPFFWGIGLFFKLAFFFLFFLMIAKFFGFWAWRMAGGPPPHWAKHRHWPHGHYPPGQPGEEGGPEERTGQYDSDEDIRRA